MNKELNKIFVLKSGDRKNVAVNGVKRLVPKVIPIYFEFCYNISKKYCLFLSHIRNS